MMSDQERSENIENNPETCKFCEERKKKAKKQLQKEGKNQKGAFVSSWFSAKKVVLCFKKPLTLDGESLTTDPNNSDFTFGVLRAFIEKNEFYSKECNCNPHLDVNG